MPTPTKMNTIEKHNQAIDELNRAHYKQKQAKLAETLKYLHGQTVRLSWMNGEEIDRSEAIILDGKAYLLSTSNCTYWHGEVKVDEYTEIEELDQSNNKTLIEDTMATIHNIYKTYQALNNHQPYKK